MQIIHCTTKQEYETCFISGVYGKDVIKAEGFIHCSTWNSFMDVAPMFYDKKEEMVLLCIESDDVREWLSWEDGGNGMIYPHIYHELPISIIHDVVEFQHDETSWLNPKPCTHVLLNQSNIDQDFCYTALRTKIHQQDRVCILAFSFYDDVQNVEDWDKNYAMGGIWYANNVDVWKRYGIEESQITWINYFRDSYVDMRNKIMNSSILYIPGGAPDKMMMRIIETGIYDILKCYQGLMIGYSAGAMIQLDHYHMTPEANDATFSYEKGLGSLTGFDIEVHFNNSKIQKEAIQKVLTEQKIPVYALYDDGGLLIHDSTITPIGKYQYYNV